MVPLFAFNRFLAKDIDGRIFLAVAARGADHFQVHAKELPHYRFVDLYQAAEYFCQSHGEATKVESEHGEDLNSILHGKNSDGSPGVSKGQRMLLGQSDRIGRCISLLITFGCVEFRQ